MGERSFEFRLTCGKEDTLDRRAQEFNNPCWALNIFPVSSDKKCLPFSLNVSDSDISFVAMKKQEHSDNYILRFYNGSESPKNAGVEMCGAAIKLNFGRYEVKTVLYDGTRLIEVAEMMI